MKLYSLFETLLIALCVAGSCAFMLRSYAPRLWARGIGALSGLLPASLRPTAPTAAADAGRKAGCSTCDSCGGCSAGKPRN